jgi:hypothetical protein
LIQTDAGKFQEARGKEGLGEKPWVSSSRTGIEWGHTCSDSKKFFIYCLNYRESIVVHACLTQTHFHHYWSRPEIHGIISANADVIYGGMVVI